MNPTLSFASAPAAKAPRGATAAASPVAAAARMRPRREIGAPAARRATSVSLSMFFLPLTAGRTGRRPLHLERIVLRPLDGDPAQVGELGDDRLAAEPAVARRLDAAERHLALVVHCRPVDVADPRFDALGDRERSLDVAAEDCGREP